MSTELQNVTCRMTPYSITCQPTQVDTPLLNPSQTGQYLICLPQRDGRLIRCGWLVI